MRPGFAAMMTLAMLCASPDGLGGERKPIVVVFNVEAKRVKLPKDVLELLSDHLATLMTESGACQVVPRSELKKRLLQQKKGSYKSCYDKSCQIELGRELAAEKTLSTQVFKLGKKCKVNLTLYDLKKAATESASSASGGCEEDDIVASLEKAVEKLVGSVEQARIQKDNAKTIKRPESKDELFKEAKRVLEGKQHVAARTLFVEFLKKWPSDSYSDDALYFIAYSYYAEKQYKAAAIEFQRVRKQFPRSDKAPDALMMLGYCFFSMGRYKEALPFFREFVNSHPDSSMASRVKNKIREAKKRLEKRSTSW